MICETFSNEFGNACFQILQLLSAGFVKSPPPQETIIFKGNNKCFLENECNSFTCMQTLISLVSILPRTIQVHLILSVSLKRCLGLDRIV